MFNTSIRGISQWRRIGPQNVIDVFFDSFGADLSISHIFHTTVKTIWIDATSLQFLEIVGVFNNLFIWNISLSFYAKILNANNLWEKANLNLNISETMSTAKGKRRSSVSSRTRTKDALNDTLSTVDQTYTIKTARVVVVPEEWLVFNPVDPVNVQSGGSQKAKANLVIHNPTSKKVIFKFKTNASKTLINANPCFGEIPAMDSWTLTLTLDSSEFPIFKTSRWWSPVQPSIRKCLLTLKPFGVEYRRRALTNTS